MDWIIYAMLGAALSIAVLALLRQRRSQREDAGRSLEHSLAACRTLLALIAHFQQHRGMSSAWLAGDQSFASKLESKAREIDALIQDLRPIAVGESVKPHPCLSANDLSLFRHHWVGLREKLGKLTVEQSIAEHSQLIEKLLHWLAALGESRLEPLLADRDERAMVRNYASRLPALTECLGQARAVGLSVATRRSCTAVARVRLMFLIARAESILQQAGEGSVQDGLAGQAAQAVRHMAALVRTRMLGAAGVEIDAQEYFADATRAVDAVFAWISADGKRLSGGGMAGALPRRIPDYGHA